MQHPVFEESTSPLTCSNDGRIRVTREIHGDDVMLALPRQVWTVRDTTTHEPLFATYDRVKSDAFIAGYDEAERRVREHKAAQS